MTERQFREFWAALGNVVRIAMQAEAPGPEAAPEPVPQAPAAAEPAPQRDPSSTAVTERASATQRQPAAARALGFAPPGSAN
jgi:hypothetical protein